jgi:DNA-directed RNA polymerase subunit E'/Rpb7
MSLKKTNISNNNDTKSKMTKIKKNDNNDDNIDNNDKKEIINTNINNDLKSNKLISFEPEAENTLLKSNGIVLTNSNDIIYPYENIILPAPVVLEPSQLRNKLEHNIKGNLIKTLEGKCFKDYGLITKIHKIITFTKPIIEAESMTCIPITHVKFSTELCIPVSNKFVIFKITEIVKEVIRCENGPILSFILSDRINPDIFYKDSNRNFRIKNKEQSYLTEGQYVKIYVIGSDLNFDTNIIAIGVLHDLATEEEVKLYYRHNTNINLK